VDETTRNLIAALIERLDTFSDGLNAGQLTPVQWHNAAARELFAHYLAAYSAASGLAPDVALRQIKAPVAAQVEYLNRFTREVEAGRYDESPDALKARLLMYAGSLKSAGERGKYHTWDLPYWPAEGTDCHTNCGCRWELDVRDAEELDGDAYWRRAKDDSCATCRTREQRNPHEFRGGVLQ
jgi:hypothetical protein